MDGGQPGPEARGPHPGAQLTWGPHVRPPQLPEVQAELGHGQDEDAGGHGQKGDGQRAVWLSGRPPRGTHSVVCLVAREQGAEPGLGAAGARGQSPPSAQGHAAAPRNGSCPELFGGHCTRRVAAGPPRQPPQQHLLGPRFAVAFAAPREGPRGTVHTLKAEFEIAWRQRERRAVGLLGGCGPPHASVVGVRGLGSEPGQAGLPLGPVGWGAGGQ